MSWWMDLLESEQWIHDTKDYTSIMESQLHWELGPTAGQQSDRQIQKIFDKVTH